MLPPESPTTTPCCTAPAAMVSTIGFAPKPPTAYPWTAPIRVPSTIVETIATGTPNWSDQTKKMAVTAAVTPRVIETNDPLIMITVIPTATIPTKPTDARIARRLPALKNPCVVSAA